MQCKRTGAERLEPRVCRTADFGFAITAGAGGSDRGNALDIDAAGNSIVAGVFNGTVDFDSSSATTRLTAPATDAAFIAEYSKSGRLIWAKAVGGNGEQNIQGVATDAAGDVYAAGYFSGTLDADPGTATHTITAKGQHDAFVLKLTAGGQFAWAKTFGGTGEEGCTALDVDSSGNAFALGMFSASGDYDPGTGTKTLNTHGSYDVFLTTLDSAGNLKYALSVGGQGEDFANGVSVDATGRVVIAGTYKNSVDLDSGPATHTVYSAGGKDVFVLGLDGNGAYRFGKSLGGSGDDQAGDVRLDSAGNAIVVGQFSGTADFDPSSATVKLASAGSTDAFIAKLNSSGSYVWAERIGGSSADRATDLAVDSSNDVYVTGQFAGTVDFNPGSGTAIRSSNAGSQDVFALKLTAAGDYLWSRTAGGSSTDIGEAIGVYDASAYTFGTFAGSVDFDPSTATQKRTSAGGNDWFLWELISV